MLESDICSSQTYARVRHMLESDLLSLREVNRLKINVFDVGTV
jgi:hypothetical protein